jgi:AcrR family transcriptional regulator
LDAARAILHEEGVRSLGVSQVLSRAELSTRAFYRHFDSKEALLGALFLQLAQGEMERLRAEMSGRDPVGAVAAWIKGRLDLAFDPKIQSDLREISLHARAELFISPEVFTPAYSEILRPLIHEIDRGTKLKQFADVDPVVEAISVHGVVWVHIERQWATGKCDADDVCKKVQSFCLRGLGVQADVIDEVLSGMANAFSSL